MIDKVKKNKLLIVFIALLVLVILLGIKIYNLEKKSKKKTNVDFVIPVIKKNSDYDFKVTLNDLKKDNKVIYIFKITNYRNKNINKKNIKYNMNIDYSNDLNIKVLENSKEIESKLSDIKLTKNKKDSHIYKLIITPNKDLKDSTIAISIRS